MRPNASQQKDALVDHLGGANKKRVWYGEAERLGGLEVDHELEFGGPHDRQVGGFLAVENPSGINAGLAIGLRIAGPIAHPTAGHDVVAQLVNRG